MGGDNHDKAVSLHIAYVACDAPECARPPGDRETHPLSTVQLDSAHGGGAALTVDGCTRGVFATCGQKTDFKVFG
jgi:hypothetical protein